MVLLAAVTLWNIEQVLLFLAVLSVLVVLHELGHFILARLYGVRVLEFAVGMGPKIAGWRSPRTNTLYSLRALPIGGYCAMHGEDNKSSEADQQRQFQQTPGAQRIYDEDNFQAKGPWQRLAIVAAGPISNFVLALLILLVSSLAFGVQSNRAQPLIGYILPNSPAARAGLRTGDRIIAVDGKAVRSGEALVNTIHHSHGRLLHITYDRNGARTTIAIRAVACPPQEKNESCIGFSPINEYRHVPLRVALHQTAIGFLNAGSTVFGGLGLLISHPQEYAGQLRGPVGMAQVAMALQDWGWGYYFSFAALISFALGAFNLLPIPALDGGRAAFIIAELVRGKPVDPEKEAMVHITGFALLIALVLAINFYNAVQIYQGKGPFQ